ncbi:MAG: imidazole glycerol phosphate synthase subunit HisF [Thermoplasmata archaeon]
MTVALRILPCLDLRGGRVVKGVRFEDLRDAGDPVEAARRYEAEGADELVVLDIEATVRGRGPALDVVRDVAGALSIPLTVGGGVASLREVGALLAHGADKVAVNTAAFRRPELLSEIAEEYGMQCAVVAIDAARTPDGWQVVLRGGREPTGRSVLDWARAAEAAGAGEFLVTSIDADGTRGGYDREMYRAVRAVLHRPLIASGGFGRAEDLGALFGERLADAALIASRLHEGAVSIPTLKRYLRSLGLPVRSEEVGR